MVSLFLKKWPPWGTESRRSEQLPSLHAWLFVFQQQTIALQATTLWSLVQWMQPCVLRHIYHCAAIIYTLLLGREVLTWRIFNMQLHPVHLPRSQTFVCVILLYAPLHPYRRKGKSLSHLYTTLRAWFFFFLCTGNVGK